MWAGVITFRLDALPEQTIGIAGGLLQANQSDPLGDPYAGLGGSLTLSTVEYFDELTPSLVSTPIEAYLGTVSTSLSPSLIEVDVTDAVTGSFDDGDDRLQFRFRFLGGTDLFDDNDLVHFWSDQAVLWVTAAYP